MAKVLANLRNLSVGFSKIPQRGAAFCRLAPVIVNDCWTVRILCGGSRTDLRTLLSWNLV